MLISSIIESLEINVPLIRIIKILLNKKEWKMQFVQKKRKKLK